MKKILFFYALALGVVFSSCSVKNKLSCSTPIKETMQTRKTYTLHVVSSQGCGYCHLIMQYLTEIGACGLADMDIVFHEFLLRDFPRKQKSDINFSKYPDCAEVRLADDCSDGLTNVYPRTIIYDNKRGKIINKITGYSPQLLGSAIRDIVYR